MKDTDIFVFGSNLEGRHRRGAAKDAIELYGAIMWQGIGLQGRSYALPTKMTWDISLPLLEVASHVHDFLDFASSRPELTFYVTRVGCGLAGFKDVDIAPLFAVLPPDNCVFDPTWSSWGLKSWDKAPDSTYSRVA